MQQIMYIQCKCYSIIAIYLNRFITLWYILNIIDVSFRLPGYVQYFSRESKRCRRDVLIRGVLWINIWSKLFRLSNNRYLVFRHIYSHISVRVFTLNLQWPKIAERFIQNSWKAMRTIFLRWWTRASQRT